MSSWNFAGFARNSSSPVDCCLASRPFQLHFYCFNELRDVCRYSNFILREIELHISVPAMSFLTSVRAGSRRALPSSYALPSISTFHTSTPRWTLKETDKSKSPLCSLHPVIDRKAGNVVEEILATPATTTTPCRPLHLTEIWLTKTPLSRS